MSKLDQHEDEILKLLSHGVAKAAIARMYGAAGRRFMRGCGGMEFRLRGYLFLIV